MESLVFLVLMFLVGGVLQTLAQRKQQRGRQAPRSIGTGDERKKPRDLLEVIRHAYEQAERGRLTGRPGSEFPQRDESLEEMVEEATSLEIDPEVRSIEQLEARPERVIIDHDDAVEETVARRLTWVEEHAKPISPKDHRAFDQAIRTVRPTAPVAADPAADRLTEIRKMVVWREVFGPPKSMQ